MSGKMDISTFTKMTDMYGADFSRWEGCAIAEIEAFLAGNSEARRYFEQAEKLDAMLGHLAVEEMSPDLAARITQRIDAGESAAERAGPENIVRFNPRPRRGLQWHRIGGGAALAASVVLMLLGWQQGFFAPAAPQAPASQTLAENEIQDVLAAVEDTLKEEAAFEEVDRIWEMAAVDVRQNGSSEPDIDRDIDELFEDDVPYLSLDVWEVIMEDEGEGPGL